MPYTTTYPDPVFAAECPLCNGELGTVEIDGGEIRVDCHGCETNWRLIVTKEDIEWHVEGYTKESLEYDPDLTKA